MAGICIHGAGLVGCYIGGRLLAAGADVGFVGRERIASEIRRHGLALSHYQGGRWQLPPSAIDFSTDAGAARAAGLVLVTVKSAATHAAAAELATILRPKTVVISFQNGLGHADRLRNALPGRTVLEGMVPFNVVASGPGTFHQASQGALAVKAHAELAPYLAAFTAAGLPLSQYPDIVPVQWAKLLFNLNNAINALANVPLKEELSQRPYRRCLALAQAEALALLDRSGIRPARLTPLPANWLPQLLDTPDWLFARLASKMLAIDPVARSSMADDLAAGRPTEIDWINGEVLRLAEQHGTHAPVNERLHALVQAAESSAARRHWSGESLLAELLQAAGP
ncbi:2-dehydropantoate 2-reductase [Bosea sp. BIWAKO-01]|uniref:2-dehydropantoate 2-reductase n=1 Tax=Bosea sp. BIWAKO-01 TaxID=506668 RepID=UPI000853B73E|nr:2-dehydropantoate 2-reductase [Bosea sp. BIWAKO-01]